MKNYEGEEVQPLWMQLYKEIDPTLKKMNKRNSAIRAIKFSQEDDEDVAVSSDVGNLVNKAEQNSGEDVFVHDETLTDDERKRIIRNHTKEWW